MVTAATRRLSNAGINRAVEMFSALGNEARVRIVRLLLSAHPKGMVVGQIQSELKIPNSTLSHHLEKLKSCNLVRVRRDGRFLWYTANDAALRSLLSFLFAECCSRNHVIAAEEVIQICR
jgi:DNA-binding transcriptional ArsR family regulator